MFSGHIGRRGDEMFLMIGRKVHSLFRDRGGWADGMGARSGKARLCLISDHNRLIK